MLNILINSQELKTYFTCAELATDKMDAQYKSRFLREILSGDSNYLHFVFTTPIVQELERMNSLFQQTKADAHTLYWDLHLHQQSLHNTLYDTSGREKKHK